MRTIQWYHEKCTDPFSKLTAWLVSSHERYNEVHPYERMKHQYGKLATEVHKFSESLKQLHGDNQEIMDYYYMRDKWDKLPEVSSAELKGIEEGKWVAEMEDWRKNKKAREVAKQEAEDKDLADAMADVGLEEVQSVEYYGNGGKHKDTTGRYDAYSGEYIAYRDEQDIFIRVDEEEEEEEEEEGEEEEEEYSLEEAVADMELDG